MPTEEESKWVYRFTAGKVPLPGPLQPTKRDAESIKAELRMRQDREGVDEQALKDKLVADAVGRIGKVKEDVRKKANLKGAIQNEKGKETMLPIREPKGRQEKGLDTHESGQVSKMQVGDGQTFSPKDINKDFWEAMQANGIVIKEGRLLGQTTTKRSYLEEKTAEIKQREEKLFTDEEIEQEIYTPMVRDGVIGETVVANKYSATQRMIDGSNDYYIKECQSKGKKLGFGAKELTKSGIQLGATVATTIIGSLGPSVDGKMVLDHANTMDQDQVSRATDITNGVAATLTGLIDAGDQLKEWSDSGDFPVGGLKDALSSIGLAIGKIVAGATGNATIGLLVSDSINGALNTTAIVAAVVKWQKDPSAPPPWQDIIKGVGGMIASGLAIKSDKSDDTDTDLVSTRFANASTAVSGVFAALASAQKNKLIDAIRKGQWESVFLVVQDCGIQAGKMLPAILHSNQEYNAQSDLHGQDTILKAASDFDAGSDTAAEGASELLKQLREFVDLDGPETASGKIDANTKKLFEAKQKEIEEAKKKAEEKEIANIADALKKEQEEYQKSLVCLASKGPTAAEYKTIAKLVEKLERDRAIWDGLTAMFGGAIGAANGVTEGIKAIASEVAAPLKIAGQLIKFIVNLKAAADRLSAWLDWREGQKDAESAVSPYATAIDNFARNQGQQFSHYSLQAAANAIAALLAAGEMSPLAPAFKIAGAGVTAAAATEDMVYKFYKQMQLRRAWAKTREALDPKNLGNRKMALLVREMNPTLAKYTVAFGALVARDPIAITAMNRIGIDREVLANSGNKVAELKTYLVSLYRDDGEVVGLLAVDGGKTKVPTPELTSKAWTLSCLLWTEKEGMKASNPPLIVANLAMVETMSAQDRSTYKAADFARLLAALAKLQSGFESFSPLTENGSELASAKQVAQVYAEQAQARHIAVDQEYTALLAA